MYTGTQALGSIDGALHTAQSQINQLEQTIEQTTQRLLALEREEIDRFRDLARIRVDLLASGEIISHLDESERTTARILEERTEGQAKLAQEMRESEARQQSLERMRSEQSQRVEQAETLLDQREAETQQRLQADADYQRQLQIAQQAERVAKHAEEKTELALADRQEKGEPYQQDALFIYLWQRRYGTSEYRANPLTRALDDWVAGAGPPVEPVRCGDGPAPGSPKGPGRRWCRTRRAHPSARRRRRASRYGHGGAPAIPRPPPASGDSRHKRRNPRRR